jgi:hypothetical protein
MNQRSNQVIQIHPFRSDEPILAHPATWIEPAPKARSRSKLAEPDIDPAYIRVDHIDYATGQWHIPSVRKIYRKVLPGPHTPNIPVLTKTKDFIIKHFPEYQERWITEINNKRNLFPSEWFYIAIKRIKANEILNGRIFFGSFSYVDSMLHSFARDGSPGRGNELAFDDAMVSCGKQDHLNRATDSQLQKLETIRAKDAT